MLKRMVERGLAIAESLIQAYTATPSRPAKPVLAFIRVGRAIRWATALAALLAGLYRLPTARGRRTAPAGPLPDCSLRDEAEVILPTAPESYREGDRWMRTVFATRSIGEIAIRLCRDFGIAENSELWPVELIALTQTPAEWSAATFQPLPPRTTRASRRPGAAPRFRTPNRPAGQARDGDRAVFQARYHPP